MKKPETLFKDKVIRALNKLDNIWFFKSQEVSVKGIPDFIICACGQFIGLEIKKSSKEKADPLQERTLYKIWKAGGVRIVASPENWEDNLIIIKRVIFDAKPESSILEVITPFE